MQSSPPTPKPRRTSSDSSHDGSRYFESSNGFDDLVDPESAANGFGNLADELAEVFDEEDDKEDELGGKPSEAPYDDAEAICHDKWKENEHPNPKSMSQCMLATSVSPVRQVTSDLSRSIPKQSLHFGHKWQRAQYDGSDDADDDDDEPGDTHVIPASLEARLAVVERLARRGAEANGSDVDEVVPRLANALKDLGSQSGVENSATCLITSQRALTTHLSDQSRTLLTLTHALVSPVSFSPPDPAFIEDLLPLLTSLVLILPTPMSHALSSLHNLYATTADLTSILTYLSDTLHMMRQTTSLASRKLRVARELVVEMRSEMEAREVGIRWLEKGGWQSRLAGRECARVCGEVVGGFEEVCASWRKRLAGQMTGAEVGAA